MKASKWQSLCCTQAPYLVLIMTQQSGLSWYSLDRKGNWGIERLSNFPPQGSQLERGGITTTLTSKPELFWMLFVHGITLRPRSRFLCPCSATTLLCVPGKGAPLSRLLHLPTLWDRRVTPELPFVSYTLRLWDPRPFRCHSFGSHHSIGKVTEEGKKERKAVSGPPISGWPLAVGHLPGEHKQRWEEVGMKGGNLGQQSGFFQEAKKIKS